MHNLCINAFTQEDQLKVMQ